MSNDVISAFAAWHVHTRQVISCHDARCHQASRDLTNRGRVQRSKLAVRAAAFSAGKLAV